MIARTLLLRPKLIVADEPVSMVDASLRVTILTNLLQLKEQFGISLVYITHDLATAYQISDHILVLHRGVVVEEGTPEQVVKHPQHDYTKLLIGSIPVADPTRTWGDELGTKTSTPRDRPICAQRRSIGKNGKEVPVFDSVSRSKVCPGGMEPPISPDGVDPSLHIRRRTTGAGGHT